MTIDDLQLVPDLHERGAYYDRLGNRWVFASHAEYAAARCQQVIGWLTRGTLLCFL